MDDSPAECAEVAAHCVEAGVGIILLPREPTMISRTLEEHWLLDQSKTALSRKLTAEDSHRTTLYRELGERKQFVVSSLACDVAASASLDAFAASLNLRVNIMPLDEDTAFRAAQLTERTNQHNTFKWPMCESTLLAAAKDATCFTVDATDRFGEQQLSSRLKADLSGLPLAQMLFTLISNL